MRENISIDPLSTGVLDMTRPLQVFRSYDPGSVYSRPNKRNSIAVPQFICFTHYGTLIGIATHCERVSLSLVMLDAPTQIEEPSSLHILCWTSDDCSQFVKITNAMNGKRPLVGGNNALETVMSRHHHIAKGG